MHRYRQLSLVANGRPGNWLINMNRIDHLDSENPRVGSSILPLATTLTKQTHALLPVQPFACRLASK
jgi:hypothetical protein